MRGSACSKALTIALAGMVVVGVSGAARGDGVAEFHAAFDGLIRDALASATIDDDVQIVGKLMEAARLPTTGDVLAAAICEQVHRLGVNDPRTMPTAIEALALIAERDPSRRDECRTKTMDAYQKWFREAKGDERAVAAGRMTAWLLSEADAAMESGDDVQAMALARRAKGIATGAGLDNGAQIDTAINDLIHRRQVRRRIDAVKEQLKADPTDRNAATELVRLHVAELDRPHEARKYTFLVDEQTKRMVDLVAGDESAVTGEELMSVGDWLRDLAGSSGGAAKVRTLQRSMGYYSRYADAHAGGLRAERARLAIAGVMHELGKLGGFPVADGNLALAKRGAKAKAQSRPQDMIDGDTTSDPAGRINFAFGNWPNAEFVVELDKAYMIRQVRMRLWDFDKRFYRYQMECSTDGKQWTVLANRTKGEWSGWQQITVNPTPMRYIRVMGMYNSSNGGFHIVELEAYSNPPK